MKRKRLMNFIRTVAHLLIGDDSELAEPLETNSGYIASTMAPEHGERRIPVYKNGELIEFQVISGASGTSRPPDPHGSSSGTQSNNLQFSESGTSPSSNDPPLTGPSSSAAEGASPVKEWSGWPDGLMEHHFTLEDWAAMGNTITIHWAHRYRSTRTGSPDSEVPQNGRLHRYICKGILRCTRDKCPYQDRPNVRSNTKFQEQLSKRCQTCESPMEHVDCTVICEVRKWKGGYWLKNTQTHTHEDPNHLLHLVPSEKKALRDYVHKYPKMTPLQAIAGVQTSTGTGPSVADISSVLQNADRTALEMRNIAIQEVGPGGDTFLDAFLKFKEQYPDFIRRQVIAEDGVTVICVQTPFMRSQIIHKDIIDEPVNGIVTDGAHKFFKNLAILIVSSIFSVVGSRWIPGLFSYSNGSTANHYKIHFLTLFESIAEEAASQFLDVVDGLFAGVVDFSDAQRIGFQDAFVIFWNHRSGGLRSEKALKDAAGGLLRGCEYHFEKSVTRVSRIGRIVAPQRAAEFKSRVKALRTATSKDDFHDLVKTLLKAFPGTKAWLEWWIRHSHAIMLFPSQRTMNEETWNSLPSTTNAEESLHNTLRIVTGNRHELLPGLRALHTFAEWCERTVKSEAAGHPTRYGALEPHKNRADKYGTTKRPRPQSGEKGALKEEHDDRGRAPDTAKELDHHPPKRQKTRRQQSQRPFSEVMRQSLKEKRQSLQAKESKTSTTKIDKKLKQAKLGAFLNIAKRPKPPSSSDSDGDDSSSISSIGASLSIAKRPKPPSSSDSDSDDSSSISSLQKRSIQPIQRIPGYPYHENSCWLDSSLSLLFATMCRDWADFLVIFEQAKDPFSALYVTLKARYDVDQFLDPHYETTYVEMLRTQRDILRKELNRRGALVAVDKAKSALYQKQSLWGWLSNLSFGTYGRREASSTHFAPSAYFELLTTEIHSCSGCSETNGPHVEVTSPARRHFEYQLSAVDHATHHGSVALWFHSMLSLQRTPLTVETGCWRVFDGERMCSGERTDVRGLVLSIPVVLIIEIGLTTDGKLGSNTWDFPSELYPSTTADPENQSIVYDLVGLAIYRSSDSHFIIRFASSDKKTIFDYDDIDGYLRSIPGASISTHLAGRSIPLEGGSRVCSAIYHLRGGAQSQLSFFHARKAEIALLHPLQCFSNTLEARPRLLFNDSEYIEMKPTERFWISQPLIAPTREWIQDSTKVKQKSVQIESPLPPESEDEEPAAPIEIVQSQEPDHPSSSQFSASDEGFDFLCRCGLVGNGNILYRGDVEGTAICCEGCGQWSHIACQRDGRAFALKENQPFFCDGCDPRQEEVLVLRKKQLLRNDLLKIKTPADLPPLDERLSEGKGALARCGDFWYPVRLIQKERNGEIWKVKWWRDCQFDPATQSAVPGTVAMIPKADVVDSLWMDCEARRKIRLGQWKHPSYDDEVDNLLSDPSLTPYSPEVHDALKPHKRLLRDLFLNPEKISNDVVIPAKTYLDQNQTDYTQGWVTFGGGVSIVDRARIANWFETHVSKIKEMRHAWLHRLAGAHAITLFLAEKIYQEAVKTGRLKKKSQMEDFLPEAWQLQQISPDSDSSAAAKKIKIVDVDAECLRTLEEAMFERSSVGGIASFYQWGLSAGDHQRQWDPWAGTPLEWNYEDYAWTESEMQPESGFIDVPMPKDSDSPKKSQPKARPVKTKPPVATSKSKSVAARQQPKRGQQKAAKK